LTSVSFGWSSGAGEGVFAWHNEKYIKKPPLTQAHPPTHTHTYTQRHRMRAYDKNNKNGSRKENGKNELK